MEIGQIPGPTAISGKERVYVVHRPDRYVVYFGAWQLRMADPASADHLEEEI